MRRTTSPGKKKPTKTPKAKKTRAPAPCSSCPIVSKLRGAPPKYHPYMDKQAYHLTLLGGVDRDLCELFDIDGQTLHNWKKRYKTFFDSIKEGKLEADANVGKSLYQRATGYSHPEEKIFIHEGVPIRVETTKHHPPDTASMIFWLSNRRPDLWRRNPDNAQSNQPPQPINVTIKVDHSNDDIPPTIHSS